jgi:hypothetical protein
LTFHDAGRRPDLLDELYACRVDVKNIKGVYFNKGSPKTPDKNYVWPFNLYIILAIN